MKAKDLRPQLASKNSGLKFIWTTKGGLEGQEKKLANTLGKLTGAEVSLSSHGDFKALYHIKFVRGASPTDEKYVSDLHKRLRAIMNKAESSKKSMDWVVKTLKKAPSLKEVKLSKSRTRPNLPEM